MDFDFGTVLDLEDVEHIVEMVERMERAMDDHAEAGMRVEHARLALERAIRRVRLFSGVPQDYTLDLNRMEFVKEESDEKCDSTGVCSCGDDSDCCDC